MISEYQLFICDITKQHAPICVFVSNTPFPCFIVGDRFDDEGWKRLDGTVQGTPKVPVRYTIHSIKHVISAVGGKNIMQIGLNLKPYLGNRSPAFEEDVVMNWREALAVYKQQL